MYLEIILLVIAVFLVILASQIRKIKDKKLKLIAKLLMTLIIILFLIIVYFQAKLQVLYPKEIVNIVSR